MFLLIVAHLDFTPKNTLAEEERRERERRRENHSACLVLAQVCLKDRSGSARAACAATASSLALGRPGGSAIRGEKHGANEKRIPETLCVASCWSVVFFESTRVAF